MKARWGLIIGLVVATLVGVPLATAGAQAPPTTADAPANEGSIPPGGTVNCEAAAELTPDHGPPGTVVEVFAQFSGNCDDVNTVFLTGMECIGEVSGGGLEGFSFPMVVDISGEVVSSSGTFTAPPTEPDPPVVDAVEELAVTVTCTVPVGTGTAVEGNGGTTYVYPPATYALELFADPDGDQPTLVDNDVVDVVDVVDGSPTFTG